MRPEDLREFRSALVRHANQMPAREAASWLERHRLLILATHSELSPSLRDHLHLVRRSVLAQNILRIQLYQDLVQAAGPIPLAPLKGIALLDTLYASDPSLRPMSDIDLLIPAQHADALIARLTATPGLNLHEPEPSHRIRRVHHHRVLTGPRGHVELHTRLGTAFIPKSDWDAVSPKPGTVHGLPAYRLSAATELVHLVVYFYKHRPFCCLG